MMRIKLETAVTLADILARLAINRIPAPDSRRILLEDYAALRPVADRAKAKRAELARKHGGTEGVELIVSSHLSDEVEVILNPVKLAALDKIPGLTIATINLLMENNIVEL